MDATDDASVLEQLHEDFVEAFRSNDPEKMGVLFSDSAVLLPPRRALVSGKANVVTFWQGAQRMQDLAFEPTDVEPLGESVLREAGKLQITMRGEGRETVNMPNKYAAVWVRAGGTWKLDSLIWNGSAQGRAGGGRNRAGGGGGGGYGQQGAPGQGYGQRAGAPRSGPRRRGGGGGGGGGGYGGGGGGRRPGPGGGQGGGGQGGGGQGGGYGGGGGRRPGPGGGQGGGAQRGGGGYGQGGGGYGQRPGGGQGDGGGQGGGGHGGGGFGRRVRGPDDDTPMVPRID